MLGFRIEYVIDNFSDVLLVSEDNLPNNKLIGVYFLYNSDKEIIYVGKSVTSIRGRLRNHLFVSEPAAYDEYRNAKILANREFIKYFSYTEVPKELVDMVERFLINSLKPINNTEFNYK